LSVCSESNEKILGGADALSSVRVDRERLRGNGEAACVGMIESVLLESERSPALARESARAAVAALAAGLTDGDHAVVADAVRRLAGLGEGRTPAADDFLVGVLHALRLCGAGGGGEALASRVAETAAPLTTTHSAGWLRAAARGETIPAWGELLTAVAAGNRERLAAPLARVAATGHSSGLASLAGFVAAWRALSARSPG